MFSLVLMTLAVGQWGGDRESLQFRFDRERRPDFGWQFQPRSFDVPFDVTLRPRIRIRPQFVRDGWCQDCYNGGYGFQRPQPFFPSSRQRFEFRDRRGLQLFLGRDRRGVSNFCGSGFGYARGGGG